MRNLRPLGGGEVPQSNQNSSSSGEQYSFLPKLITVEVKDQIKVIFDEDFSSLLLVGENQFESDVEGELLAYFALNEKPYRAQLVLKGASLLVAFFPSQKTIRIASSRLSDELLLVEGVLSERASAEVSALRTNSTFLELKTHAEEIASLERADFPSVSERVTRLYDLPDLSDEKFVHIRDSASDLVTRLLGHLNEYKPVVFERFSDFGLGLTAQFALLRIHMLKFLAILPSLDHDQTGVEVKRLLLESMRRLLSDSKKAALLGKKGDERALPNSIYYAVMAAHSISKLIPAGALAGLVRTSVRFMAKRFIAGESIELADQVLKELMNSGRDATLDQLGELVVSEKEADIYEARVLELIRGLGAHIPKGSKNTAGILRAHVSIKVSALCSDFKPEALDYTYKLVAPRLKNILLEAKKHEVFINIDAEHYHYRDIVFEIYSKLLLETAELHDYAQTGIVIQAYLRDASKHLEDIVSLAKKRGMTMPVRLVKGAYWDAETVEARAHGHLAPEFLNKEETDIHFRQLIVKIFESSPHLQLGLASHNFSDHCFAEALRSAHYSHLPEIEHQCLHMTYEALSTALTKMGWAVRNYVPVGSLLVGMAYLVRRIMENSSQVGVLTIMRSHKKKGVIPAAIDIHQEKKSQGALTYDEFEVGLNASFANVAPARTYLEGERKWVVRAFSEFKAEGLGHHFETGRSLTGEKWEIYSSSNREILVGTIDSASSSDCESALKVVHDSFSEGAWARKPALFRAQTLQRAAHLMLSRRSELSALISYEAGKAIPEALGDVDEAIDFLCFYAREEVRLHKHNSKVHPRGPIAVIAPWNFPLAIPCGMVCGALVAGNTVILKSAEQTPLIAEALVSLLHEAGVPTDVLIHLPGLGETIGDQLVKDSRIAGIIFTGSKAVGQLIMKNAGARFYTNPLTKESYPVRVITEMGGKNAIIVTANAELDETVSGILYSSFGHAGQKCSAASRVIVHQSVKDRLVERLKEAINDLQVGIAYDFSTFINPVITPEDQARLREQVAEASLEARDHGGIVHVDRTNEELPGLCVGPALIELPLARAKSLESFARRELFGPVLHIIGVRDNEEAIEVFNSVEYGLTGGIFSQSQDDIDAAVTRLEAGNLYVNRTITGARVAIEPFGGFKLSGTGPKAGSRNYLEALHHNRAQTSLPVSQDLTYGEGVGYQFDLAKSSRIAPSGRTNRLVDLGKLLVNQIEVLYGTIAPTEKELVSEFNKWINRHWPSFVTKKHLNRVIPGQESYNDLSLAGGRALFLTYSSMPYGVSVIRFLSALGAGAGVTVLARNQEAFEYWSKLVALCHKVGFSKENVDVYFATKDLTHAAIDDETVSRLHYDGPMSGLSKVYEYVYAKERTSHMLLVSSPFDTHSPRDFKRHYEDFVFVRSLAINTMRHGAPLNLDL